MVLFIAVTLPSVQTRIAQYFTKSINEDFGVNISIDKVEITIFGGVQLKNALIVDHHRKVLIYTRRINTTILGAKQLLDGDLIFGDLALDGAIFNLKTYILI